MKLAGVKQTNFGIYHLLIGVVFALSACVSDTLSVGSGEIRANRNIAYGPLKRQKFNVYRPAQGSETAPVVVFFYGGGWSRGDRKRYSFVAKALAKQGFVAAIPDYRVYPEVSFPEFVIDGALAIAAIKKRLAPNRPVFLMGHSAGAHIAAMLTVNNAYLSEAGLSTCKDIAGLVGLAGPYDFNPSFGKFARIFPAETRLGSMPIRFAENKSPPALLLHGDNDRTVRVGHSLRFHARLKASGNNSQLTIYKGNGHVGVLGAYSTLVPTTARSVEDVSAFIHQHQYVRGNTCS